MDIREEIENILLKEAENLLLGFSSRITDQILA
ncbi:hypothetical protein LCGC14_1769430, partial [marine sediment metagenome]